jgi:hypothetical protein
MADTNRRFIRKRMIQRNHRRAKTTRGGSGSSRTIEPSYPMPRFAAATTAVMSRTILEILSLENVCRYDGNNHRSPPPSRNKCQALEIDDERKDEVHLCGCPFRGAPCLRPARKPMPRLHVPERCVTRGNTVQRTSIATEDRAFVHVLAVRPGHKS